jgi:hypothetical protein
MQINRLVLLAVFLELIDVYVNIIRPFYADTFKGSYFANPLFDVPTTDDVLLTR